MEVGVGGAGAEHNIGVFGVDGVPGVACGKGGEGILPGGEHDILIIWAKGIRRVSFKTMHMGVSGREVSPLICRGTLIT